MNIAMLLDNPFIHDKRVYKEAKSLINNGHGVTVICQKDYEGKLPVEDNIDGIKVRRLFQYKLGTTVLVDKYLRAHFDLYNKIETKYDVFHCHDFETWPIGYILSEKFNARFICDAHEYFPNYTCKEWYTDEFKYNFTKKLIKVRGEYIKQADRVITVSDYIADVLKKDYNLKEQPIALYNTRAINTPLINNNQVREKYNIEKNTKIILYQGMSDPTRGLDLAIKSLKYLNNVVLIVAGDDLNNYNEKLKIIAKENRVEHKVIFTGFMESDSLFKYTCAANVLIYFSKPSTRSKEYALPNKFFDYVFSEKPFIVSNLPAMKKFVEDYNVGHLIDIYNPDIKKISNVIKDVLDQDKTNSEMKKIKEKYCWEEQERKLNQLYSEI